VKAAKRTRNHAQVPDISLFAHCLCCSWLPSLHPAVLRPGTETALLLPITVDKFRLLLLSSYK
jgi:hypothetical protein